MTEKELMDERNRMRKEYEECLNECHRFAGTHSEDKFKELLNDMWLAYKDFNESLMSEVKEVNRG